MPLNVKAYTVLADESAPMDENDPAPRFLDFTSGQGPPTYEQLQVVRPGQCLLITEMTFDRDGIIHSHIDLAALERVPDLETYPSHNRLNGAIYTYTVMDFDELVAEAFASDQLRNA